jgi:hypothetical protein
MSQLKKIAAIEDRDCGYLASWFLSWGIEQYLRLGNSLVALKPLRVVPNKQLLKHARTRLALREEVARLDAENATPERRRA